MEAELDKVYKISKSDLFRQLDSIASEMPVYGPTGYRGNIVFKKIGKTTDMLLDYISYSAMSAPRNFIYYPSEISFRFELNGEAKIEEPVSGEDQIVFGVHPCDLNALKVLDLTFLSTFVDPGYAKRREKTLLVGLNCTTVGSACFCASMGTGPFYKKEDGCDLLLTDIGEDYLAQILSCRGGGLVEEIPLGEAKRADLQKMVDIEAACLSKFQKFLDIEGLPELLGRNLDHAVYKRIADSRCLNCANCVMVCPTCFCYDLKDETDMDLKTVKRVKRWDACHELHFAEVHGGNFRKTREARLRQWVTHKLGTWVKQFGVFGCVGCGRCMTWCPTNIDLALMAQEIQEVIPLA